MKSKSILSWTWTIYLLIGLILSGCSNPPQIESPQNLDPGRSDGPKPQFETLGWIANLHARIFNPSIKVNMQYQSSFSESDKAMFQEHTRNAILQWLAPLRSMPYGNLITSNIEFVSSGGDIVVYLFDGVGRPYYSGQCFPVTGCPVPHIWLSSDSQYGVPIRNYYVYLHEFGHAFGLGDVYIEGVWSCKDGQYSKSVMCNAWAYDLTADDIRGIRYTYCKEHPTRCNPRNYEDMYGGNGGTLGSFECGPGRIVYGFQVKHGGWIDSMTTYCRNLNGSNVEIGPKLGGDGGYSTVTYTCPGTSYATGLRIRSGGYVDSIQIYCSDGSSSGRIGGNGGNFDVNYMCPSQYPSLKGVRVRRGAYVDKLGLVCSSTNGALIDNWYAYP